MRLSSLLLLGACAREEWRNADLQLDITESGVVDTDLLLTEGAPRTPST